MTATGDAESAPPELPSAVPSSETAQVGRVCGQDGEIAGDFEARGQADLDALSGCAVLRGSLRIHGASNLDLTPLAALRAVHGTLAIGVSNEPREGPAPLPLRSLKGLEALESVGTLIVEDVAVDLQPLSGLRDVQSLQLINLPGVADLQAFSNLIVSRELALDSMPDLVSLAGARLAPAIESLSVSAMPRLASLAGVEGVEVLQSLWVQQMPALSRLELPDSLGELYYAWFSAASQLTTLDELSRFSTLTDVRVSDSSLLADLGGIATSRDALHLLSIERCPALASLDSIGALPSLEEVYVIDADAITNLDVLAQSAALQRLHIFANDALVSLPVFAAAGSSMRGIRIGDNPALIDGPQFPNLETLYEFEALTYQNAELTISGNAALRGIGSFPLLESSGMVTISGNPLLETASLPSLEALTWLRVADNERLVRLELNVQRELRYIELEANLVLGDVTLGAPSSPLDRLTLRNNPALPTGLRQQLLDLSVAETELTLD